MSITKNSNKAALVKYARESLGVNPSDELTQKELLTFIVENGGEIDGISEGAEAPVINGDNIAALEKTKVRILVFDNAEDTQKQVIVGVNGVHYTIKRGVEVTVPYPVYEVLRLAIRDEIKQVGKELVTTKVPTEPFQVIKFDVQPDDYPEEA